MTDAVLIGGYYGAGNVGDEAILTAMLNDLREIRPRLDLTVLSWNPEETGGRYQVKAVHWRDIGSLVDAARASDLIIVGGGGLFHDHWGLDPESYLRVDHGGITSYGSLPLLARMLGIPCMLYGVGIGPLESDLGREHTRLAAARCQLVTLRDRGSYQVLKEAGFAPESVSDTRVEVFADPAFSLPTSLPRLREVDELLRSLGIKEGSPVLGVNVRYWDRPHPPEVWVPQVARGLEGFLAEKKDLEVLLLPFQISKESIYTDDKAVCEALRDALRGGGRVHVLSQRLSPGTAQALIGHCKLLVGMRYHALVMAIREGVPAVALPYDPKVAHLMAEVGLEAFCPSSYAPPAEEVQELLERAWVGRGSLAETLDAIVQEMKPKAQASAELAVRLLERSSAAPDVGLLQKVALGWVKALEDVDRRLDELGRGDRDRSEGSRGLWRAILSWGRKAWRRVRDLFIGDDEGR